MIETLFPLTISQSILEDALHCDMYFFRKHIQGFHPGRNVHLIAGGHIAKALELTRKAYFFDKKEVDEAIEIGYNYIIDAEDTGDEIKSNARLAFLFKKYFQKFPIDQSWQPLPLTNGEYSIEYEFEFDLGIPHPDIPDRNVTFSGKLDMLAEKKLPGGTKAIGIVDEKTTKNVKRVTGTKQVDLAAEEELYLARGQLAAYSWAIRQLGLKNDYGFIRRIPILKDYEPAYELTIPISEFFIENWSKTMFNTISELVEKYKFFKETFDPFAAFTANYTDSCNSYGRSCYYKKGCTQKDGEEIIAQHFPQSVYDRFSEEVLTLKEYKEKYKI